MADPLSSATRATKRNLLLASVIAISANAFNVSIDRIPMGGLSISFDDRLFAFLLAIVLLYLLSTFILYYCIDIKNVTPTEHQKDAEARYERRIREFESRYSELIERKMNLLAGKDYYLNFSSFAFIEDHAGLQPNDYHLARRGQDYTSLSREENEALFTALDNLQIKMIGDYKKLQARDIRRAKTQRYAVRSMYWIRNYGFDGILPIALGVFAAVSLFAHWDLSWLQGYLPSFKELNAAKPHP